MADLVVRCLSSLQSRVCICACVRVCVCACAQAIHYCPAAMMNESCHYVCSHVPHMNESCLMCKWITSRIRMSRVSYVYKCVTSLIRMSHVNQLHVRVCVHAILCCRQQIKLVCTYIHNCVCTCAAILGCRCRHPHDGTSQRLHPHVCPSQRSPCCRKRPTYMPTETNIHAKRDQWKKTYTSRPVKGTLTFSTPTRPHVAACFALRVRPWKIELLTVVVTNDISLPLFVTNDTTPWRPCRIEAVISLPLIVTNDTTPWRPWRMEVVTSLALVVMNDITPRRTGAVLML